MDVEKFAAAAKREFELLKARVDTLEKQVADLTAKVAKEEEEEFTL
jgi:polyhydroxyalkanoate synthesis regulator phasin